MKDDKVYMAHIMEAVEKIERYSAGKTYEDLLSDSLLQDGLARQLQIIGEACKQLPKNIKDDNPNVPWKAIAGMRDVLVHQYAGIDHKAVWDAVKNDVPELKKAVEKLLAPAGGFKAMKEKAERYAAEIRRSRRAEKAGKRARK